LYNGTSLRSLVADQDPAGSSCLTIYRTGSGIFLAGSGSEAKPGLKKFVKIR
jgi:hypothetical protein